jgi:hypothetical protein
MLIIVSALLFKFGITLLLIQAIRIAFSLLKIAYYIVKIAVCLVVLVICTVCLGVQKLVQLAIRVAIAIDDWRWRRRYGEILPPLPPE